QNTALLRSDLLETLGAFEDPAVIAEARKRFAAYLKDPTSLSADLRHDVLHIVADHADAATWDQIHALAQAAKSNLEKRALYVLLGQVHDRDLAAKALALSLSDEVPITTRPSLASAVSYYYPDMAVDFVSDHDEVFEKLLEPDNRASYLPRLASSSRDTATIAKLDAYAAKHIPESARGAVIKAEGIINENAGVREKRLPEVDAWLAAHPN
ncbi:MAG: ERAP1-like C-terminal domain-containing protein, partial [Gammaproteobacteria bacterium]